MRTEPSGVWSESNRKKTSDQLANDFADHLNGNPSTEAQMRRLVYDWVRVKGAGPENPEDGPLEPVPNNSPIPFGVSCPKSPPHNFQRRLIDGSWKPVHAFQIYHISEPFNVETSQETTSKSNGFGGTVVTTTTHFETYMTVYYRGHVVRFWRYYCDPPHGYECPFPSMEESDVQKIEDVLVGKGSTSSSYTLWDSPNVSIPDNFVNNNPNLATNNAEFHIQESTPILSTLITNNSDLSDINMTNNAIVSPMNSVSSALIENQNVSTQEINNVKHSNLDSNKILNNTSIR